jgi:hypothetical protein
VRDYLMSDPFPGLAFPAPGGVYASVDDLLLVSDLCEVDLLVTRWKRNGASLRIRVRALDFDQQEKIDRSSLVKIDGQIVKSESRFAAATLKEAVIVPTLTDAQAQAMCKHNPSIISAVVRFVWDVLSALDQETVDAIVEHEIPDTTSAGADAAADANGGDEPADDFTIGESFAVERARDPALVEG